MNVDINRPRGWAFASIGEICESSQYGYTAKAKGSGSIHFLRTTDITSGHINWETVPFCDVPEKEVDNYLLQDGDVVISRAGSVGYSYLISSPKPAVFASYLIRFRPLINPKYFGYFLKSQEYWNAISERSLGIAVQNVNATQLSEIRLPVATLPEQTRIVEKLEELLSDLDAGVAELKTAQRKLTRYRQSLLKAAVEGSLTAEWRAERARRGEATESGAQLLARILTERRARWEAKGLAKFKEQGKAPPKDWKDKYPEPVRPDTTALPTLPPGWVWTSLGDCFDVAVGATPSRKMPSYWNGDIPWVSSGEVRFNRVSDTKERITKEGLKNTSTQINPVGSVLLGMIGEGKTRGQVSILDIEAANNQNCAAIWVSDTDIPPEYVYYWLWSRYEETRRDSSGNNQPALNKSIVERIPLPLPPLKELDEIVSRVNSLFELIVDQSETVDRSLKQSSAQRKNILKAAFSGRLVPQDPNDEPASALLARICAERETREASAPKRRRKSGVPA